MGTAWAFLGVLPAPILAQDQILDDRALQIASAPEEPVRRMAAATEEQEGVAYRPASRRLLVPLYVSSAVLQMLDVHSTRKAIALGHSEANPFMSGIASNTTAFVAVKAATAATAILVSERLRKRNRVAAIGVMIAVNVAAATVVAHNYRVAR